MDKKLIATRKYAKETYKYFLNTPSYEGETGVLGVEITPYISVETPVNCFGYSDTVLLNTDMYGNKTAYTLNRGLTPWILKKIQEKMIVFEKQYC